MLRQSLEAEVASIVCNNPRALEEFQERQHAIDELRRDTTAQAGDLEALEGEINDIRVRRCGSCRNCTAHARQLSRSHSPTQNRNHFALCSNGQCASVSAGSP